jgi:uncharacterized protein YgiM (DUF1202 family)
MHEFPQATASKKSFSLARFLPVAVALGAVSGVTLWFVKPKPDVRYVRAATAMLDRAEPDSKVVMKLGRGAQVTVMLANELNGWAMITVQPSTSGFIPLSAIDKDRRPVLTGAYKAKALQKAISLQEEPHSGTAQVDQIPAKTMVQVWGYTATSGGNWAEVTRYDEKGVGYVLRDELEAAFE